KSFASGGQIARLFGVSPSQVEGKPQGSFMDLVEYLTHEHPNQLAKGKHHYADEEVHASFDWRPALDDHKLARSAKAGQRASLKKRDAIREAVMLGEMTLKQVRENERAIYIQDLEKLQKLRQDFMLHQPAPRHRMNYYIGSPAGAVRKGRTGKTQLAKLFARMLYPDLEADECYHVATDARVPLQNYKGQPVIIWDDYSVPGLLAALGSREGVWQVFDDHPSASDANIKYGSVRLVHAVNIIAKTTPYAAYLDGLAGEYTDASGNVHEAEDRSQSLGRFPVVFEVTPDSIEMLLNRGFADDTDDFLAYQKVARMRASMKAVCSGLDAIESDEEREAATFQVGEVLLRPIIDQHRALQPVADRAGADVVGELLAGIEVLDGEALEQADAER
ncbi:MAG: RNA helicase domain-containing protein, partial [Brevibacterium aurantiacum]|nr:RNA helicase domain-containing protein [Brevibacterium aurantiacum]